MVITALIIIGALIAFIWVFIELKRFKHKLFALLLIAVILFGYLSFVLVFKDQPIDYKSATGLTKATKIYFVWLGSVFGNMKSITTNAVQMEWQGNQSDEE